MRANLSVFTATVAGVLGSVAVGAIAGGAGAAVGFVLGVGVGLVAGRVVAREDAHASARTRELDAIIGITGGAMGAGTLTSGHLDPQDGALDAWAAEWLTPPPPVVGFTPPPSVVR